MGITNLTPHNVVIDNGEIIIHPSMGNIRLTTKQEKNNVVSIICKTLVYNTIFDNIEMVFNGNSIKGLKQIEKYIQIEFPPEEMFIVSSLVAQYINSKSTTLKNHFVSPNTNPTHVKRDVNGNIISVDSLQFP